MNGYQGLHWHFFVLNKQVKLNYSSAYQECKFYILYVQEITKCFLDNSYINVIKPELYISEERMDR